MMSRREPQPRQPLPGKVLKVITNHVRIKTLPQKTYLLYTVAIKYRTNRGVWQDEKRSEKRIRVIDRLQSSVAPTVFVNCVFDGDKLLFVPYALHLPDGENVRYEVNMSASPTPNASAVYKVKISRTAHQGITPLAVNDLIVPQATQAGAPSPESIQAINLLQLIIRQHSNNLMKPAVNAKAYFSDTERITFQGTHIELWRGYFQSVRPTLGRLLINIDTTVAPFIARCGLIDYMLEVIGSTNVADLALAQTDANFQKLKRALKNLHIEVQFNKASTKIIRGLEPRAGRFTFLNDQRGQNMTVEDHYRGAYQYRMRFPKIVGVRLNGPSAPKPIIVPAELCTIKPKQFYKRRLTEKMAAEAVRFSTLRPDARRRKIEEGLSGGVASPISHYQQSQYIRAAGMQIGRHLESVTGRLLPAPQLQYGGATREGRPSVEIPRGGAWNMVGKKLSDPQTLDNWAVVNFASDRINDKVAERFVGDIKQSCRDLGMSVRSPAGPFNGTGHNVEAMLDARLPSLNPNKPTVILVLLPQNAKAIRQRVKHWGDVFRGVLTQCVREEKVLKANNQYFNNVGIKLNARLGGVSARATSDIMNWMKDKPFMVVGADVSHPAPGQMRPSMVSLVYSHDPDTTRYHAVTDLQAPRLEQIENMRRYASEAFHGFVKRNNKPDNITIYPRRIVFYRDGISEGQFAHVAVDEVAEFKAGIKDALKEYKKNFGLDWKVPAITYIVVGKRHHVVFFPRSQEDGDRTGNLPSGFVTDDGLKSPFAPDFFLQSHSAIQGTSRSSHYVLLHDEIWGSVQKPENIEPIKQLSFHLCHTYAKATRAISIPAPVYYADLACARGAFHCANVDFDGDSDAGAVDLDWWRQHFGHAHGNLRKMMYFL